MTDPQLLNATFAESGKWSDAATDAWTQALSLRTGPRVNIQSMGCPRSRNESGVVRSGRSTGGREGMILSQRYPTVFNGIVSGDPAMRTGLSNLAIAQWIPVAYNQAAPKDGARKAADR